MSQFKARNTPTADGSGAKSLFLAAVAFVMILQSFELTQAFGQFVNSPFWLLRPLVWALIFALTGAALHDMRSQCAFRPFVTQLFVRGYVPLVMAIAFAAFVVGPLATEVSLGRFVWGLDLWRYLLALIGIPSFTLPGVFSFNVQTGTVNGMLWTVPVWMTLGIFSTVAPIARDKRFLTSIALAISAIVLAWTVQRQGLWLFENAGLSRAEGVGFPLITFLAGLFTYGIARTPQAKWLRSAAFAGSAVLLTIIAFLGDRSWSGNIFFCIFMAFSGWALVTSLPDSLNFIKKRIDTYVAIAIMALLIAFPIQQFLVKLVPLSGKPAFNFFFSTPIVTFFALIMQIAVINIAAIAKVDIHLNPVNLPSVSSFPRYSSGWWKRKLLKLLRTVAALMVLGLVTTAILMVALLAFQGDSRGV